MNTYWIIKRTHLNVDIRLPFFIDIAALIRPTKSKMPNCNYHLMSREAKQRGRQLWEIAAGQESSVQLLATHLRSLYHLHVPRQSVMRQGERRHFPQAFVHKVVAPHTVRRRRIKYQQHPLTHINNALFGARETDMTSQKHCSLFLLLHYTETVFALLSRVHVEKKKKKMCARVRVIDIIFFVLVYTATQASYQFYFHTKVLTNEMK